MGDVRSCRLEKQSNLHDDGHGKQAEKADCHRLGRFTLAVKFTEDIGGEESGGIGTRGHIPERDGLLNSLLLLEATTRSGRSLAALFREVEEQTGWRHAYDRIDLMLSGQELVQRVQKELQQAPDGFAGRQVSSVERLDGVKLNLTGDAWLLFRASGTEPVLRIYCEAQSRAEVDELLQAAEAWVAGLGRT